MMALIRVSREEEKGDLHCSSWQLSANILVNCIYTPSVWECRLLVEKWKQRKDFVHLPYAVKCRGSHAQYDDKESYEIALEITNTDFSSLDTFLLPPPFSSVIVPVCVCACVT